MASFYIFLFLTFSIASSTAIRDGDLPLFTDYPDYESVISNLEQIGGVSDFPPLENVSNFHLISKTQSQNSDFSFLGWSRSANTDTTIKCVSGSITAGER